MMLLIIFSQDQHCRELYVDLASEPKMNQAKTRTILLFVTLYLRFCPQKRQYRPPKGLFSTLLLNYFN